MYSCTRHALVIVQLYASCLSNWTVRVIKLALVALEWVLFQHLDQKLNISTCEKLILLSKLAQQHDTDLVDHGNVTQASRVIRGSHEARTQCLRNETALLLIDMANALKCLGAMPTLRSITCKKKIILEKNRSTVICAYFI